MTNTVRCEKKIIGNKEMEMDTSLEPFFVQLIIRTKAIWIRF